MRSLILATLALFVALCSTTNPAIAVDKALIGSWIGNVKGADVRWEIRFGGNCSWTQDGSQGSISDSGMITANDGNYMKSFNKGSDSGTYTFSGPDKFITVSSKLGRTEWTRLSAANGKTATPSNTVSNANSSTGSYNSASSSYSSNASNSSSSTNSRSSAVQQGSAQQNNVVASSQSSPPNEKAKSNKGGPSKFKQFLKGVGTAADVLTRPEGSQNTYNNGPNGGYQQNSYNNGLNGGYQQNGYNNGSNDSYQQSSNQLNANQGNFSGGNPPHQGMTLHDMARRAAAVSGRNVGGDAHAMLIDNFPLPPAQDEAAQFGLPGLARLAGGGMRKREFRAIF